jgi:hypothetical protein
MHEEKPAGLPWEPSRRALFQFAQRSNTVEGGKGASVAVGVRSFGSAWIAVFWLCRSLGRIGATCSKYGVNPFGLYSVASDHSAVSPDYQTYPISAEVGLGQ